MSAQARAAGAGNGDTRAVGAGVSSGFQIQVTVELLCGEESVRGKGAARHAGRRSLGRQPAVVGSRGDWVLLACWSALCEQLG